MFTIYRDGSRGVEPSLINNFLFIPPYGQTPENLVVLHAHTPETAIEKFSYLDYQYYRANNHVFTDVAAMPESISISFSSDSGARVSIMGDRFPRITLRCLESVLSSDVYSSRGTITRRSRWQS